jgi:arylsulfate sulfotransferase
MQLFLGRQKVLTVAGHGVPCANSKVGMLSRLARPGRFGPCIRGGKMTQAGFLRWCAFSLFLTFLTLLSIGCGSSSNPQTAVSQTHNPLVADYAVALTGAGDTWVEFGTDTSYGRQTSTVSTLGNSLNTLSILVAGMKASTTYHMRAHVKWTDGRSWTDHDQTFTTGAIPPQQAITLTVTRPTPSATPQQGVMLLNLADTGPSSLGEAVSDLDGNVIWFYSPAPGDSVLPLKPLANGHMIADVQPKSGPFVLREIDLSGQTIRELSSTTLDQALVSLGRSVTLNAFHHDILSLPNGHTILLANMSVPYNDLSGYPGTTNVIGDVLIDLDQNWKPVWFWSTFDHLDVNRHLQGLPDWTHSNAIVYMPNDGNLLLSIRHQSWVIKIDYANGSGTGDILWKLGEDGNFAIAGGDPSQWFYAQHYPNVLNINGSQMSMIVVDNGNFRVLDSNGTTCGNGIPCYSRGILFDVDEAALVATPSWANVPGLFSSWGGSIDVVDGGNVEFDLTAPYNQPTPPYFQPRSRIQEITQDGTQSVVWQMDVIGANAYRGYRIPSLYPGVTWTK